MDAVATLDAIKASAEKIKCGDLQRFPEAASPGDYFRQGDVYITYLSAVPNDLVAVAKPERQLAPGNTQGSRHILDSLDGVKMFVKPNPTELDGPVLELTKERVVTHPEHGDVSLPCGVYATTYQRTFADELRRVKD